MQSGKYFNAGKDTADALVLALGPVHKVAMAINTIDNSIPTDYATGEEKITKYEVTQMTDIQQADFAAGLFYGLTGDDQKSQFEACWSNTEKVLRSDALAIVADYEADNFTKAQLDQITLWSDIKACTVGCEFAVTDVVEIKNWLSILNDPIKAKAIIGKNYTLHMYEIHKDHK